MKVQNVLKLSFFTNLFLSILKVIVGFFGKSSALISDGIHSFSDLITDMVALFGNGISLKPADKEHPYGHGKSEYITSFVIGLVVLVIGLSLISSISNNEIFIPSIIVVIVSVITIIAKYLVSSYLIKEGMKHQNVILISSGRESRADVVSSIFVLISSILMQFSDKINILKYSDKVASIIVGLFIIRTGFKILKDSISMMLGEIENDEVILDEFKEIIYSYKKVKEIDELVVLKYGPYYRVTTEISMDANLSLLEAHNVAEEIEKTLKLRNPKAEYITIHINPFKDK